MKLKKSLLAGATAATLAFAGTGIATAQEGSLELPTGSISQSSEQGSGEGSSTDGSGENGIQGSLEGLLTNEDSILGSFVDGDDMFGTIGNITTVISLIAAAIGLAGLFG